MKSWEKYSCLTVDFNIRIVCDTMKQKSLATKIKKANQSKDYLSFLMDISDIDYSESITLTKPASTFDLNDQDLISKKREIKVSEILIINSEQEDFSQIQEICHIDFRKLKIAIDDYGNFNYLNRDF